MRWDHSAEGLVRHGGRKVDHVMTSTFSYAQPETPGGRSDLATLGQRVRGASCYSLQLGKMGCMPVLRIRTLISEYGG
jgi:hypothetical protein